MLAPGCKRIIVDPDYLKSLHRPNVSLNWDSIEEVVEEGIRLKTGEVIPLDIIIFGTGYSTVSSVVPSVWPIERRITGSLRNGRCQGQQGPDCK